EKVAFLALFDTYCPIRTLTQRVQCHIGNLIQRGIQVYITEGARAIKNRVKRRMAKSFYITADEQPAGGAPVAQDPLERTVRANLQAEEEYTPVRKVYPGKITFFFAQDRGSVKAYEDNRLTWKRMASGGLEVHLVPGDHITMREEPHVAVLAEKLTDCLNRAQ